MTANTAVLLAAAACALFAAGCRSADGLAGPADLPPGVRPISAKFFLETNDDPASVAPLPVSGVRVPFDASRPVLREYDIATVTLGRTELLGVFLRFQFNPDAARSQRP